DDGRTVYLAAGAKRPQPLAVRPAEAVHLLVAAADHEPVGGDGGGAEVRKSPVPVGPRDLAGGQVGTEHLVAVVAQVGVASVHGRRSGNEVIQIDRLRSLAVCATDHVEDAVAAAEADLAAADRRGAVDVV